MTFRTRLLLIFTAALVAVVGLVEWLVLASTREAFERAEAQRVDALVAQFRKEFDRRGAEIASAIRGIAGSDTLLRVAIAPDPAIYHDEAAAIAKSRGLALLQIVAADGTIVSSAEWPARFGYKEDWITAGNWEPDKAFLRREELPDGVALAMVSVSVVRAGDRKLYVTGGQQLDTGFLSTLVLPAGMRAMLLREGERPPAAQDETYHVIPLTAYDKSPLGSLVIASSREALRQLESSLRRIGIVVASLGILVGVALSWWATARVTRPVRRLAQSAGLVAAGKWGTTVETASTDEIGQLARAFNRMTHELVEQRERLVQAERVAAWRELARRLAHELKNPLFPLQITVENMQRARDRYPDQFDEVFREGSATLLAELANLKQIIARFSDFARMPAPEIQHMQINELVRENLKLFEGQLEQAQVRAHTELDPAAPAVDADPEQISRVLRNLILNAIDAMPEGGTLTVRTRRLEHGVRLEVSDSGHGLTPEECERLFTPYYTTKTHGTGLGLAIVQSVVSDHKGRISVESEKGKGTTFRIELG